MDGAPGFVAEADALRSEPPMAERGAEGERELGAAVAPIEPRRFRDALGRFATGVTVVTARHPTIGLLGVTANSFNSVSLDPPLILFSIANTARRLPALLESPGFVVNVLGAGQRDLAERFARGGPEAWSGLDTEVGRFGAPVLPGTIAAFDCLHYASHEGGDHRILIGRVIAMEHDGTGEPLLYFASRFRTLAAG